jgi:hypothetical protein
MAVVVEGKYGIKATVLADSIAGVAGPRMITYEAEYPRIILAELNTHRMLPKNSHSSRAIPFLKMVEQLNGRPVRFGAANKGMQDTGEDHETMLFGGFSAEEFWDMARKSAIRFSREFYQSGYHKQVFNRITEPYQMMRTVLSGTEWSNFFWLRHHDAADPTLQELARVLYEARKLSQPELIFPGEWHLPYVGHARMSDGKLAYFIENMSDDGEEMLQSLTTEQGKIVSAARSAAVSFRNEDYGLTKCVEVHGRLLSDDRKHGSSFEHQASPMKSLTFGNNVNMTDVNINYQPTTWEPGISHMDRQGQLWSGPLRGFIQYRKLIPGENYQGEI